MMEEDMGMGEPTYTDGEYWDRLNSNAYDEYDDLEAKAEELEAAFYGAGGTAAGSGKKARRERLTNKSAILKTVEKFKAPVVEVTGDLYLYPLSPRAAPGPAQRREAAGATSEPARPTAPAAPTSMASNFDALKAYDTARALNLRFRGVEKVSVGRLPPAQEDILVAAYDHMMQTFAEGFASRYSGNASVASDLAFDRPVPSYFANVGGETIARRKALSIAGLRNLVRYGPTIYSQLERKLFVGRTDAYASNEGMQLMRTMTGNVVDLDSTVLRCDNVTTQVINMSNKHKGLPTFSGPSSFAESTQAAEIAVSCATPMLQQFIARFKLSENAARSRKVHQDDIASPIPIARDNSTRGHTALWHYVNAGQNSFHVNVPCVDDVVGALLRAPFACVEHYASLHVQHGQAPAALQAALREFFEDCVADSCFNMKWKAIEEFGAMLAHRGTIVDVLQKTQMEHQDIFTADFFDADGPEQDNEIAEMTKLVSGKRGRDKTGAMRPITRADVALWVHAAAAGKPISI